MKALIVALSGIVALCVASTLIVSPALAQSDSCTNLGRTLSSLDRNRDFRNLPANVQNIRILAEQIQQAESQFVRAGCQKQLNANGKLSGQCRNAGRGILNARDDYNKLAARIETGQGVAQSRERTLQQIARFGCGTGSRARITENGEEQRSGRNPFQDFIDQIFGSEGRIVDQFELGGSTLRTVCVRACDGYYWPVSFSTVTQYLGDDAALCSNQCPGSEVELFYYSNGIEDTDDMVNLSGLPYKNTPNAFRYRQEFDASCTCKAQINYGSITLAATTEGGVERPMITFADLTFPLPLRDPRRSVETVVAEAIHIPLPRKRPLRVGEEGYGVAANPTGRTLKADPSARVVVSGNRIVRIVGPDTPYGQAAAEGS